MTARQIHLVQKTFGLVTELPAETVGGLFYGHLFVIAPEVRPLFNPATTPEQSRKLLHMLAYVVSRLNRVETIRDELAQLARRHVRYGVQERHYTYVGESLLWTLEQGLGDAWTDEVRVAWTNGYMLLANTMLAAAYRPEPAGAEE